MPISGFVNEFAFLSVFIHELCHAYIFIKTNYKKNDFFDYNFEELASFYLCVFLNIKSNQNWHIAYIQKYQKKTEASNSIAEIYPFVYLDMENNTIVIDD